MTTAIAAVTKIAALKIAGLAAGSSA